MADLIHELRVAAHVQKFVVKHRVVRRYNSKVNTREIQEGNMVFKEMVLPTQERKQKLKWEGPHHMFQNLPHGTYKLQELEGPLLPILEWSPP